MLPLHATALPYCTRPLLKKNENPRAKVDLYKIPGPATDCCCYCAGIMLNCSAHVAAAVVAVTTATTSSTTYVPGTAVARGYCYSKCDCYQVEYYFYSSITTTATTTFYSGVRDTTQECLETGSKNIEAGSYPDTRRSDKKSSSLALYAKLESNFIPSQFLSPCIQQNTWYKIPGRTQVQRG